MLLVESVVAAIILCLLIGAWFLGKRLGAQLSGSVVEHSQFGVVQGAILALLGLLLGFCFAGAVSRFVDRQQILTREASSIGTLDDIVELLDADGRREAHVLLAAYAKTRRSLFGISVFSDDRATCAELEETQERIWAVLSKAVHERPDLGTSISPAYMDFSGSLTMRNAADARHIPVFVLILLVLCAIASIASIGMAVEITDRRLRVPASIFVFLIWATLWLILDLDFPRSGFIQLSPKPLDDVIAELRNQ